MSTKLYDINEFDKQFIELTRVTETYQEAYEKLEEKFEDAFGKRRYKNYESYRKSRCRRMKGE